MSIVNRLMTSASFRRDRGSAAWARAALGGLLLAPVLLGLGCPGKSPAPRGKVLLIGLDGAEWDIIQPLVEAGEMPNFARLMHDGVYGKLRSLEPLAKSPAIWTTIATGKSPDEHGITTFVDEQNGRPLTQNIRRVRAVWNILSGLGRTVGVVGWLMSWPAEEVNGFVVTDYLQYGPGKNARFQNRTYPPGLELELRDLVTGWEQLPWSYVERFFDTPLDTTNMDPELEGFLRPVRMYTAADLTFARIAERLYARDHPDFFAVYIRGMDTMGHLYWNYMNPDAVPAGMIQPAALPYLRHTVIAYYKYVDALLGPILDLADDKTTIVVCSDHGFRGGAGKGVEAHKLDGVLVMSGHDVARGEITGATVYDITPTLLVLLGLPPARDMPGKVLWSALAGDIPHDRFQDTIPTYETGESAAGKPVQSPVDEEIKERLRSLGYID